MENIVIRALLLMNDPQFKEDIGVVRKKYSIEAKLYPKELSANTIEEKINICAALSQILIGEGISPKLLVKNAENPTEQIKNNKLITSQFYPDVILFKYKKDFVSDICIIVGKYFPMHVNKEMSTLYGNTLYKLVLKLILFDFKELDEMNPNSTLYSIIEHFAGKSIALDILKSEKKFEVLCNCQPQNFPSKWMKYTKYFIEYQFNNLELKDICIKYADEIARQDLSIAKALKLIAKISGYSLRKEN